MFRNGRWFIPQYVEGSAEYYKRQRLLALLSNVSLSTNQDDIVWKCNADGVFTVKSYYNFINDSGIRCAFTRIIWKAKIPEKVKIFIWLVTKNRILTIENLKKRGWVGRDSCSLCNEAEETNFHILITCPFTQSLWQKILSKLNISEPPTSVEDSWLGWREKIFPIRNRVGTDICVGALWWCIWKERNQRIFQSLSKCPDFVDREIRSLISSWASLEKGTAMDFLKNLML
jgi:hypothetical protein